MKPLKYNSEKFGVRAYLALCYVIVSIKRSCEIGLSMLIEMIQSIIFYLPYSNLRTLYLQYRDRQMIRFSSFFSFLIAENCMMEKNFACVKYSLEEKSKRDCPNDFVAYKSSCLKYDESRRSYTSAKVSYWSNILSPERTCWRIQFES